MKVLLSLLMFTGILSCSQNGDRQVVYGGDNLSSDSSLQDSSAILIAGLPFQFDSSKYLLFTKGEVAVYKRGSKLYFGSDSQSESFDFSVGYRNLNSFRGSVHNFYIQHIDSSESIPLTDQTVRIEAAEFLNEHYRNTGASILILEVYDQDTNQDHKLNHLDVKALYLSQLDQVSFIKLTTDLHQTLDWNYIEGQQRLYLRTIEDRNKDGEFTGEDEFHYYYMSLSGSSHSLVEFNPIK